MQGCRIEKSLDGFKVLGLVNFATVVQIFKQGINLLTKYEQVRLDFIGVTHTDSSALALLLSWIRFAKRKGKKIIFVNLPSQLLEIATICEVMPFLRLAIYHKDEGDYE
jgi:phospholipid transport system transporter-binding protein